MAEAAPPKKVGRPPKDPSGGKRPTITFRCRAHLQERIQAAADAADRSVSEEVERRIEDSFKDETSQNFALLLFNKSENLQKLVMQIATVGGFVESLKDARGKSLGSKDWDTHEPTRAGIRAALIALIDAAIPPVKKVDAGAAVERIIEITQGLKSGQMLSDDEALEISALQADLDIVDMVTRGQAMAGVVSGTISADDLKSLGASKS